MENKEMSKKDVWELLHVLRDFNLIKIVPYHGVIVK